MLDHLHPVTFDYWTVDGCLSSIESWTPGGFLEEVVIIEWIGDDQIDYGVGRIGSFGNGWLVEYIDADGVESHSAGLPGPRRPLLVHEL